MSTEPTVSASTVVASPVLVPAPTPAEPSAWAPLKRPLFRNRMIASIISNTGGWMQDTAGVWLMTSLTSSPFLIALMQTAASLPVLLLGLPAGATADILDRRRLLLFWAAWMLLAAAVLGALTITGIIGPITLLILTFVLAIGTAMSGPLWQAIVPELVPRDELPHAVALNSAAFNIARAVGPAAGGLVVAAFISAYRGAGIVFFINALSFIAVLVVIFQWKRKPFFTSALPSERLMGSMRAGLRYVHYAPGLRAVMTRAFVQTFFVSGMWALLAVVADKELHRGAMGYAILNGCIGVGAVIGAFTLPTLRAKFSADTIVSAAAGVFVLVLLTMAWVPLLAPLIVMLIFAGAAWTSTASCLNIAVQLSVPPWVQARSLGTYQMVFMGGMAIGSAVWGAVAEKTNSGIALSLCAGGLLLTLPLMRRHSLMTYATLDHSSAKLGASLRRSEPTIVIEPQPDAGPVRVMITFHIDPKNATEFARASHKLAVIRKRDGAIRWGLFSDPYNPAVYVESFIVESWVEHMRQLERFTVADRATRDAVFNLHTGPDRPVVTRMIYVPEPTDSHPH